MFWREYFFLSLHFFLLLFFFLRLQPALVWIFFSLLIFCNLFLLFFCSSWLAFFFTVMKWILFRFSCSCRPSSLCGYSMLLRFFSLVASNQHHGLALEFFFSIVIFILQAVDFCTIVSTNLIYVFFLYRPLWVSPSVSSFLSDLLTPCVSSCLSHGGAVRLCLLCVPAYLWI